VNEQLEKILKMVRKGVYHNRVRFAVDAQTLIANDMKTVVAALDEATELPDASVEAEEELGRAHAWIAAAKGVLEQYAAADPDSVKPYAAETFLEDHPAADLGEDVPEIASPMVKRLTASCRHMTAAFARYLETEAGMNDFEADRFIVDAVAEIAGEED